MTRVAEIADIGCATAAASVPASAVEPANDSTPAAAGYAATTPAPAKKRGRKPKSDSGRAEVRWSNEMVEALMEARFEENQDLFRNAKHARKISEAWSKVAYRVSVICNTTVDGDRCRQQFGRLQKKWRDHKPDGKESTKTGNQDPGDDAKDEKFDIIQPYFSKKPGCGGALGEATDDVANPIEQLAGSTTDSSDEEDEQPAKKLKFDSTMKKPLTPGEAIAILGQSFDGGFNGMSDGLKAIATSLSGGGENEAEIKAILVESRKALAQTNETLERVDNHLDRAAAAQEATLERVGAHLDRAASVQEAMLKFMQSMMGKQ